MSIINVLLVGFVFLSPGSGVFGLIPQLKYFFDADSTTYFNVYTPNSQDTPFVFTVDNVSGIDSIGFNAALPFRMIIHGWWRNITRFELLRDAYMSCGDYNVVIVDWQAGSDSNVLPVIQFNIASAGKVVASFLEMLEQSVGLSMSDVYLLGEGIGASVATEAGHKLGNLSTIVGLNPSITPIGRSLMRDDAQYVEALHSNFIVGTWWSVGDSDFFINNGVTQPGCGIFDLKCNHFYAGNLFIKSICNSPYTGCREDYDDDCGYVMGGDPVRIYTGKFDVATNDDGSL